MEYTQRTIGLSNYVDNEIINLCDDDQFASNSKEVFSKFSWVASSDQFEEMEDYSVVSFHSLDVCNLEEENVHEPQEHPSYDDEKHKEVSVKLNTDHESEGSVRNASLGEAEDGINQTRSNERTEELESKPLSQKEEIKSTTSSKAKNIAPREVKPANFTSLKRKDVIYKSILRMMRRYFCNLLEQSTEYNRKEKCIFAKHKQLIKCLQEGIEKLGFNDVGLNMPFYFSAFAYPNDMKKILKESKQQFRTQNDLLCQASYVVQLVDNAFNRFSKKVFEDMLAIPQIAFMVQYYLKHSDDLVQEPKVFEDCYKTLDKKSSGHENKASPNPDFDANMNAMFKDFNMNSSFLVKVSKADQAKTK